MMIEDQISRTIRNFEPRVDNVGVEVSASPDEILLDIKVLFDIVGLETPPTIIFLYIRTNEIICPLHSLQI